MSMLEAGGFSIPDVPRLGAHVVYRLYGSRDELLYVGVTSHFLKRLSQHWELWAWHLVQRVEWIEYESRYEALANEGRVIGALAPTRNIMMNGREKRA